MKKKCRVKKSETSGDRISDLPDDVIGHILSLMPTKDAVRTSVLSRDWEYRWTSIYSVDVNDRVSYQGGRNEVYYKKKSTREGFVNFVDRILLVCPSIKTLFLSMSSVYGYEPARLIGWINAASMRNVQNLKVSYNHDDIVLPRSLLRNTCLRTLELILRCTFKVSSASPFPNLISLTLSGVDIVSESSSSDKLVLAFPVLETLVLRYCRFVNVKMVEVHAPSLTKLDCSYGVTTDCSIKIFSTSLVEFIYANDVPEDIIFIGQRVVCAHLTCYRSRRLDLDTLVKIGKLLKDFSMLKDLTILGSFTQAINIPTVRASLPICLGNLTKLLVGADDFSPKGLLELLNTAPSLNCLIIKYWYRADKFDYDAVDCVPVCIKDVLEEVTFNYWGPDHSALAKFLFKNGRNLKKVHVSCVGAKEVAEKLSTFPKCSTSLASVVCKEYKR